MKKVFIVCLSMFFISSVFCEEEIKAELPIEEVKSSFSYFNLGLGPLPIPSPEFGFGYRSQKNKHGVDFNIEGSVIGFSGNLHYLYYTNPTAEKRNYFGIGPAVTYCPWSLIAYRVEEGKDGDLIWHREGTVLKERIWFVSPSLLFGRSTHPEDGRTTFFQFRVHCPVFSDIFCDNICWLPAVTFQYGWGF